MALSRFAVEVAVKELFGAPSIPQFKRFSSFIDYSSHARSEKIISGAHNTHESILLDIKRR
jgi:hypothetical protein